MAIPRRAMRWTNASRVSQINLDHRTLMATIAFAEWPRYLLHLFRVASRRADRGDVHSEVLLICPALRDEASELSCATACRKSYPYDPAYQESS